MAANTLSILSTMPYFHGRGNGRKVKDGDTAERFIRNMEGHFRVMTPQPTDAQKIGYVTRHLKGSALDWWFHRCLTPEGAPCWYDRARIDTDYDYFEQQFKKQWFTVYDQRVISDNIDDVQQESGEGPTAFIERLMYTLRPVTTVIQARAAAAERALANYDNLRPARLVQGLTSLRTIEAHFPNGFDLETDIVAPIAAFVQAGALQAINRTVYDMEFLNIARTAARKLKQDYARNVVRQNLSVQPMDLDRLQELVQALENVHRPQPQYASTQQQVSAVEEANEDPSESQEAESDEQQDEEDSAGVDSLKGAKGKKKKGPPAKQQQGKQTAPAKFCDFCDFKGHTMAECRNFQRFKQERDAQRREKKQQKRWGNRKGQGYQGQQPQQQQQQQQPRQPQGYAPQHNHGAYHGARAVPMDVGQTSSAVAPQFVTPDPLEAGQRSNAYFSPAGNV